MHFLSVADVSKDWIFEVFSWAQQFKERKFLCASSLLGKTIALIFEKPSLRTRVSFEVGIRQMGGNCIFLSDREVGLGKREAVKDVARTIERYVDGVILRTFSHSLIDEFCSFCKIPVINALTDTFHPCQALSDAFTIKERFGRFDGVNVLFIGDANNVLNSLMLTASKLGFHLFVLTPKEFQPNESILSNLENVTILDGIAQLDDRVDVVYTDVWVSMGEEKSEEKVAKFYGFQVNEDLLSKLGSPLVMHCLPAHRGEEITDSVLDGERSIVFDQAENRLYVQKAIMKMVFAG